jgi:hypothetical protein
MPLEINKKLSKRHPLSSFLSRQKKHIAPLHKHIPIGCTINPRKFPRQTQRLLPSPNTRASSSSCWYSGGNNRLIRRHIPHIWVRKPSQVHSNNVISDVTTNKLMSAHKLHKFPPKIPETAAAVLIANNRCSV